jgi:hypothetical protein
VKEAHYSARQPKCALALWQALQWSTSFQQR